MTKTRNEPHGSLRKEFERLKAESDKLDAEYSAMTDRKEEIRDRRNIIWTRMSEIEEHVIAEHERSLPDWLLL